MLFATWLLLHCGEAKGYNHLRHGPMSSSVHRFVIITYDENTTVINESLRGSFKWCVIIFPALIIPWRSRKPLVFNRFNQCCSWKVSLSHSPDRVVVELTITLILNFGPFICSKVTLLYTLFCKENVCSVLINVCFTMKITKT